MNRYLIIIAALLTGCATAPQTTTTITRTIPEIDCRPYPRPDRIEAADVEPENRTDGWLLNNEDYLDVYRLNLALIAYQKQTRAIAQHFTQCIEQHNQMVKELNRSAP
jgi:hypothetical protein